MVTRSVQIDCIIEVEFKGTPSKEEMAKKAAELIQNSTYEELGKMIQIMGPEDEFHYFDEYGDPIED